MTGFSKKGTILHIKKEQQLKKCCVVTHFLMCVSL